MRPEDLDNWLATRLEQASKARAELATLPSPASGLWTITDASQKARGAADRTEEVLNDLAKVKHAMTQRVKALEESKQLIWDTAATSATSNTDYAPRERYARYELSCLDHTIKLRKAERDLREAEFAHSMVTGYLRSINSYRQDLDMMVRVMSTERRLER